MEREEMRKKMVLLLKEAGIAVHKGFEDGIKNPDERIVKVFNDKVSHD